jgi:hypothetical protein
MNNSEDLRFYYTIFGFILAWCTMLHVKEGARDPKSTFRLHLWHGVISSYFVIYAFFRPGVYPEWVCIASSLAYFITDLNNMICNDFIYNCGGYHGKSARVMEYVHHILSLIATSGCAFSLTAICDVNNPLMNWSGTGVSNPLIRFAIGDFSTPPLMLWRRGGQKSLFWYTIFAILFIGTRIIYHGFYFVPRLYYR